MNKLVKSLLIGFFGMALSTATLADQASQEKLFQQTKQAAEKGLADAQMNLGVMYAEGQGVKQDYERALFWFKQAADQGLAQAQVNLGLMYDNGKGVQQDYFEAVKWYKKAAAQDSAQAQLNLGVMYFKGQGVRHDKREANHYFGLACDNRNQKGCDYYRQLNEQGY